MYVAWTVPIAERRCVHSCIPHNMQPFMNSCSRKFMYFLPWMVAPSPAIARPYPVRCSRNRRCSRMNASYSLSSRSVIRLCRVGPLYLVRFKVRVSVSSHLVWTRLHTCLGHISLPQLLHEKNLCLFCSMQYRDRRPLWPNTN